VIVVLKCTFKLWDVYGNQDKEREDSKTNATLLWSTLLNLLNTLSSSEKTFYSLLFLSNNFPLFKRKDASIVVDSLFFMSLNL